MAEVGKTILDVVIVLVMTIMSIIFGLGAFLIATISCIDGEDDTDGR